MNIALLAPDLVEALGWTLVHSLWQGVLIFVLLVPILVLFKRHAPQIRYNLLCGALVLLLVGMAITFYTYLPERPYDLAGLAIENVAPIPTANSPASTQVEMIVPDLPQSFRQSLSQFITLYAHQLVTIWLIGAFIFGLRWMAGLFFINRLKKVNTRPASQQWEKRLQHWRRQLGIHKGIQLLESATVEVPLIIGHLKPVILLPIGTFAGLSVEQVEAIIIHEMAHIKRNDFLVNLLLSALEMILFYHPVFWWISNQIQQEREQCCDDIAVAACGNPKLYAQTLLLMEEKRQQNSLAMAYQGKKHHLLDRIKRICLASPASYRPEFGKAGLSLCLLLFVAAASWAKMPDKTAVSENPQPLEIAPTVANNADAAPTVLETATTSPISRANTPGTTSTSHKVADEVNHPTVENIAASVSNSEGLPDRIKAIELPPSLTVIPVKSHLEPNTPRPTLVSTITRDTIPYTINIPQMPSRPQLPDAPSFPYSKTELKAELEKASDDRKLLRSTIDAYQDDIDQWRSSVKQRYLRPWGEWQDQVKVSYEDWKAEIERKSGTDELAYALTINRGTRQYEDALREQEAAIRESESIIRNELEDYIRSFEGVIRSYEGDKKDHDERMAFHDDRMRVHDLRMGVHDSRMDIHDERMSIHDTRMRFHDSRMKAHDIIMEAFKKELFAMLSADGLANKDPKKVNFHVKNGQVKINGKVQSGAMATKYLKLLEKYDFRISEDYEYTLKINGKNTTTSYSRSSH